MKCTFSRRLEMRWTPQILKRNWDRSWTSVELAKIPFHQHLGILWRHSFRVRQQQMQRLIEQHETELQQQVGHLHRARACITKVLKTSKDLVEGTWRALVFGVSCAISKFENTFWNTLEAFFFLLRAFSAVRSLDAYFRSVNLGLWMRPSHTKVPAVN